MTSPSTGPAPAREGSGAMFDGIAERYDFVNRVISLGIDQSWRKKTVQALALSAGARVLDLATGTGDLAIMVAKLHPEVSVVGGTGDTELWAGAAHLPVSVISRSAEVPKSAKSAALGRQLDPAAYVVHRAWVGPMVLLVLDDPDDPTPYWLVSCRHPDRVLSALRG